MGVAGILCIFKLVLEGKAGKEMPELLRLQLLGKFSASNFALSDGEDNTSALLNRGGVVDLYGDTVDLCILRTLSAIWQKL